MSPENEPTAQDLEAEEAVDAPVQEDADDSMQQLVTLAILAAAAIAFLAICLPMFIL